MSWAEFVRTYWPIASFLTPFMLAGGFAWLKTQFPAKTEVEKNREDIRTCREQFRVEVGQIDQARKSDIAELARLAQTMDARQVGMEHQLKALTKEFDTAPSKLELSKDIGKVAERVGSLESSVNSLVRQLETHNQYLHTLLEKHI